MATTSCRARLLALLGIFLLSCSTAKISAQRDEEAPELDVGSILREVYPAVGLDEPKDQKKEGSNSFMDKFMAAAPSMDTFKSSAPSLRAYMPDRVTAARYTPTDALVTPRFAGIRTFARLPYLGGPGSVTEEAGVFLPGVDVAVVGLPFDTGATFKVGARFGPEAVRSASAILRPHNPEQGVTTFGVLSAVDFGDAAITPGFIEESLGQIATTLKPLAEAGIVTLGIGGDHSVTLGELRALAAVHGPLALVHFDAHGDVWDSYFGKKFSHGTVFARAVQEGLLQPTRSIQLGLRGPVYAAADMETAPEMGFEVVPAWQLLSKVPAEVGQMVRARVGDAKAFLSFDIDFFDPAHAPGTGTPEVGGPSTFQGLSFLRECTGVHWVGGDVVEVLPALDPSQITAHAAAQVGFEFLSLVAKQAKEHTGPAEQTIATKLLKGLTS